MATELAIIIPTYNERDNVSLLLDKLRTVLKGIDWEVIYVDDDSPDGTAECVWEESRKDPRIRCIKRVGRRGLSSACIEGMLSTAAPFMAVMDADLQHDEKILPDMLEALRTGKLDIIIGSRYVLGGGMPNWSPQRRVASQGATYFTRVCTSVKIQDPMSGYFMLRREFFLKCAGRLSGKGFKILLDILMSSPEPARLLEIPYTFRLRQHGESKLTIKVILDYFSLIFHKIHQRAPWIVWLLIFSTLLVAFLVWLRMQPVCPIQKVTW